MHLPQQQPFLILHDLDLTSFVVVYLMEVQLRSGHALMMMMM
jgi:hypothetical protein